MTNEGLRVVHVIDAFSRENHGIMEAALCTAQVLSSNFGIQSELWFPEEARTAHKFDMRGADSVTFGKVCDLDKLIETRALDPLRTIVVSHGCWQAPTSIGAKFKSTGFPWVYVPHGMLEPWSLRQKSLRKWVYWYLREHRLAKQADIVRATSIPERNNLARIFSNIELISHSVPIPSEPEQKSEVVTVLFMGRLHPKKAASSLAEAWAKSKLCNSKKYRLLIVGNDDGDLEALQDILDLGPSNIELREPVYGEQKTDLFSACHYFALPSHSEGLPVALLEGMAAGLVPIISDGCNLPEAFERDLAIRVSPNVDHIVAGLNQVALIEKKEFESRRERTKQFVKDRFSMEVIARQQADLYTSLVS